MIILVIIFMRVDRITLSLNRKQRRGGFNAQASHGHPLNLSAVQSKVYLNLHQEDQATHI
jgi:hypothetical protein